MEKIFLIGLVLTSVCGGMVISYAIEAYIRFKFMESDEFLNSLPTVMATDLNGRKKLAYEDEIWYLRSVIKRMGLTALHTLGVLVGICMMLATAGGVMK